MAEQPPVPAINPIEAIKLFNEFQSQSRARGEAALKLIMGISGGILTLTVGALLSATPARIPAHLLFPLQVGVGLLFFCVAASIFLMALMIVATFHMGVRWRKALEAKEMAFAFVATWNWLRIANAVLAFLILCSFLGGVGSIARVAIGVAATAGAATAPSAVSVGAQTPAKPGTDAVPGRKAQP
jgi:hypothetical protein